MYEIKNKQNIKQSSDDFERYVILIIIIIIIVSNNSNNNNCNYVDTTNNTPRDYIITNIFVLKPIY